MKYLIAALMAFTLHAEQFTLSLTHNTYGGDEIQPTTGYKATAHYKSLYAFASYEAPGLKIIGQSMGNIKTYGVGVGVKLKLLPKLNLMADFGKYFVSNSPGAIQQHEVITDTFRATHFQNPDKPFGEPATFDETSYKLSGGLGASIGLRFDFTEHVSAGFMYRALSLKESLQAWVGDYPDDPPSCNCLWLENKQRDFSSVQASVTLRF